MAKTNKAPLEVQKTKDASLELLRHVQEQYGRKVKLSNGQVLQSTWYEHPFRTDSGKLRQESMTPDQVKAMDKAYRDWITQRDETRARLAGAAEPHVYPPRPGSSDLHQQMRGRLDAMLKGELRKLAHTLGIVDRSGRSTNLDPKTRTQYNPMSVEGLRMHIAKHGAENVYRGMATVKVGAPHWSAGYAPAVPQPVPHAIATKPPTTTTAALAKMKMPELRALAKAAGVAPAKTKAAMIASLSGKVEHVAKAPAGAEVTRVVSDTRLVSAAKSAGVADPMAQMKSVVGKTARALGPAAIVGAGLVAFDAKRSEAKAAGAGDLASNAKATGAAAVAGGAVAAVGYGIGKGIGLLSKLAPLAGKVAARAIPVAAVGMAAYEVGKGYKQDGIKGAARGLADFATVGAYSHFSPKAPAHKPRGLDPQAAAQFQEANAAFSASHMQVPDTYHASSAPQPGAPGPRGWANPAVQAAAQEARGVQNITPWAKK